MDKGIVNILSSYGCKYMADDYKEMIEEIVTFVKKREKAINYTRCCKSDSEQLIRDRLLKSREETARIREYTAIEQTLQIYCDQDEIPTVKEVLKKIGRKY